MLNTTQFYPLFRREAYSIQLALYEEADLANPFEGVLTKRPCPPGTIWDRMMSIVPIGELVGRFEGEPIPEGNTTMGYTAYGAVGIEASVKVGLTNIMQEYSRKFEGVGGASPESGFAGYLADSLGRGILSRQAHKWHELSAQIFNLGAIVAGHLFYNQRRRAQNITDVGAAPLNLQYDARPMFALANFPHPAYSNSAVRGGGSSPTGVLCGWAGTTAAALADTGGYFNAYQFPPSIWALERVVTHYESNMSYDENNVPYVQTPDTLLISSHNEVQWRTLLGSRFLPNMTTNTENVFQLDRYQLRLVVSRLLIKNTWFVGKSNSPGIYLMTPSSEPEPWDFWYEASNRTWWMSFERFWGFMVRNWRYWIGGSVSIDGVTPPNYGANWKNWEANPVA